MGGGRPAEQRARRRRPRPRESRAAHGPGQHANPIHVAGICAAWKTAHKSRWTLRAKHDALRRILRTLEAFGAPQGLHRLVPAIREIDPRTSVAQGDDFPRMFEGASRWMQLHLLTIAHCGYRFAEAAALAPKHYNEAAGTVRLPTKGHRFHTSPVSPQLKQMLDAVAIEHPDPNPETPYRVLLGGPQNPRFIYEAYRRLKKRVGVRSDLWFHDLRRTTAVAVYNLTTDVRGVQEVLRARQPASTFRYLAPFDTKRLTPILDALWTPKGPVQ